MRTYNIVSKRRGMPVPYVKAQVRRAYVEVYGRIWMPTVPCAQRIELRDYDLENIEKFSRAAFEDWLGSHAGDFSEIIDFHVVVGDREIAWKSEENELNYGDCMYPAED